MVKLKFDKVTLNEYLNKYYALLAVVLVLIILAVGGILLIYPQYQDLVQVREEQLSTSEYDLVQKTQYLRDLREMDENFQAQNLENYRNLDKIMFSQSDFPLLFARMENIVESAGMKIVSISYVPQGEEAESPVGRAEPPEEQGQQGDILGQDTLGSAPENDLPDGISRLSVTMTVQASEKKWEAFKGFINTLQYNIQLIEMESLSYSPGLETYSLAFNMYFKEDDYAQD